MKKGFGEVEIHLDRSELLCNPSQQDWVYLDICGVSNNLQSIIEKMSERSQGNETP